MWVRFKCVKEGNVQAACAEKSALNITVYGRYFQPPALYMFQKQGVFKSCLLNEIIYQYVIYMFQCDINSFHS